jgi:hypothetical protein
MLNKKAGVGFANSGGKLGTIPALRQRNVENSVSVHLPKALWLGSADGLFDRISLEHYEPLPSPAPPVRSVRSLHFRNGDLWIGAMSPLRNDQTENYTRQDGVQIKHAVFGVGSGGQICPNQ